jgi:hydroxyacylglutathione hydrolase
LAAAQVVAGAQERAPVPALNTRMGDLEELALGDLRVIAHAVPGHTLGSTVFEVRSRTDDQLPAAAFTGDTVFCGGCGQLFEGSSLQLHASLQRLSSRLRADCNLFPGHEYTTMLLRMAAQREPDNRHVHEKLQQAQLARARKQPTVPSKLSEELLVNPWMRASVEELAVLCGCNM